MKKSIISTQIKVGLTTLLSIVILFGGILWVKEFNPMVARKDISVVFSSGKGIYNGDPVHMSGVKIGEVSGVSLDESNRAVVSFTIVKNVHFTSDSRFIIEDVGLMGDKALVVIPGRSGSPFDENVIHTGDENPGLNDLFSSASQIMDRLNSLTEKLDRDLDLARLTSTFETTFAKLEEALEIYRLIATENREPLKNSIASMDDSAREMKSFLNTSSVKLEDAITSFQKTSDKISGAIDGLENLSTVVDTLSSYMDSGDGTFAKLIKSDDLYEELRRTNVHIDEFIADFKKNPGKYTKDMQFKIRLF